MTYKLTFEADPAFDDVQILNDGIAEQARQKKNHEPIKFFAFFIRDENNKIQGGCDCDILYGSLYIGQLWVAESLRSKGYGTQLMLAAENYGKQKGCVFSTVNTMDWEALNFYKKLGYVVEFERHGYSKNSIYYYLRKDLI